MTQNKYLTPTFINLLLTALTIAPVYAMMESNVEPRRHLQREEEKEEMPMSREDILVILRAEMPPLLLAEREKKLSGLAAPLLQKIAEPYLARRNFKQAIKGCNTNTTPKRAAAITGNFAHIKLSTTDYAELLTLAANSNSLAMVQQLLANPEVQKPFAIHIQPNLEYTINSELVHELLTANINVHLKARKFYIDAKTYKSNITAALLIPCNGDALRAIPTITDALLAKRARESLRNFNKLPIRDKLAALWLFFDITEERPLKLNPHDNTVMVTRGDCFLWTAFCLIMGFIYHL